MLRQRRSQRDDRAERRTRRTQRKQHQESSEAAAQEQSVAQLDSSGGGEYSPSVGVLFRLFSVVRLAGALAGPLQDCDEVYNYWEPLHLLQFGSGKQTWEYAPQYALRSYAVLHVVQTVAQVVHFVFGFCAKVQVFLALRICLAVACAGAEALLVSMVARWVDRRIANYLALALAGMAGMFHAAPALLPSSLAMVGAMVGSAFAMVPPVDDWALHMRRRVVPATAAFALAAAAGWPYAAIVAVPFAVEEVVARGPGRTGGHLWRVQRALALAAVGGATAAAVVGAMAAVDSWYYGRLVVAPWNQIAYNILGRHGGTSALFGTEPWSFYIKNGLVNANLVMVLALASVPLWTAYCGALWLAARRAEGAPAQAAVARLRRAHGLLLARMAPFPLALAVFSAQPHKEERFLSIVYPHMCFCAASALALVPPLAAWMAAVLGRAAAPGAVRRRRVGYAVLAAAAVVGVLRMAALSVYYTAPMRVFGQLSAPGDAVQDLLPLGPTVKSLMAPAAAPAPAARIEERTVCMGAAWYWFPSSYWLPEGHRLQFVTGLGAIGGHLPGDYAAAGAGSVRAATSMARADFNAQNRWEPTHAMPLFPAANSTRSACDYVVDVALPGSDASFEAALAAQGGSAQRWTRVGDCLPVLDAARSSLLVRVLYVPRPAARALDYLLGQRQVWARTCVFQQQGPEK
ncbi:mannosyltransferase [Coemansia spiralis]|nr:mannosyltransferase [Coemansia spiralis]